MIKSKLLVAILVFITANLYGQSILNTVHNLSVSGSGSIKADSENEICIFCHTPHNSSPRKPLWNRDDPGFNYTLYNSSTLNASPGQPDGSSILCLSCHDGTIALGNVISRSTDITFGGGITTLPSSNSNLSTDLSDDHPISLTYSSALAVSDGELKDPSALTGAVHLENQKLQCISCHDPHLNIYDKFLVASQQYSSLCNYCHDRNGWNNSSHKLSGSTWNGSGSNPWENSNYNTVAENACKNCHTSHNSDGQARLMNFSNEEDNCLVCHNGNVAVKNIQTQFSKSYTHSVYNYTNIHDPAENSVADVMHVECADCHDSHKVSQTNAAPPIASGFIAGVKGVNTDGTAVDEIEYEYELCYRCHADSPNKPGSVIARDIEQNNVRLEFDLSNPSFHPIEGAGKNNDVRSLISPYTETSLVYCSDCHSSDGAGSPKGPHGSIYPQILKYNYSTIYGTTESYQSYELCYQCHDRNEITNGIGRFQNRVHRRHIVIASIPCSYCHDPHGINGGQGNSTNNSHLINFDLSETHSLNGILEFVDTGSYSGSCYLTCHGRDHANKTY